MRRVACYAATSVLKDGEQLATSLAAIEQIVQDWLNSKGKWETTDEGLQLKLLGGRIATVSQDVVETPTGRSWEYQLAEPTESGQFLTRIVVGGQDRTLHLFVELRAGGEALRLRPIPVDARCPEVYRQILAAREWFTGAAIVRAKPIPFLGSRGAEALVRVITHPDRNLPLVAVSMSAAEEFVPDLADGLARDLAGLAIVALIDEGASWGITEDLGKEWSCYNRAVRMYWPVRGTGGNAFSHPLWTANRLLESADVPAVAAQRLRNQLRRQLLALSTYTISEASELANLRREAAEARLIELRDRAAGKGEWQELAEAYAVENDRLRRELAEANETIRLLEDQVANLTIAAQYRLLPEIEPTIAPEEEPDLTSIQDAVDAARTRFAAHLVFGSNVEESVLTVAADAGPPDKVFEYLRTLSEMTERRREGGLGKDMLVWLKEQGAKASSESETVLNSAAEMQKRTWDAGTGKVRRFSKHLKPKDGTSPDQCVRIYFEYDEDSQRTIVGWVGRHP